MDRSPGGSFGGVCSASEHKLAAKLQDSSRAGACDLPKVSICYVVRHGTLPWTARSSCSRVESILSVVKGIKGLNSELEANPLAKLECLAHSDVPVVDSRLSKSVAPFASVDPECGLRECRGVEPFIYAFAAQMRVADLVGSHSEAQIRSGVVGSY